MTGIGGIGAKLINIAQGTHDFLGTNASGGVDPIEMGILSESFGLLLGDTTFTDPESDHSTE